MLLLILIVGINLSIGLHFCDKELQSVKIYSEETPCCSDSNERNKVSDEPLISSTKSCCETKRVDISTDDIQYQQIQRLNLCNLISPVHFTWIAYDMVRNWLEEIASTKINIYHPPESFDAKTLDILSFICILRI